jgi:hypothetical protein
LIIKDPIACFSSEWIYHRFNTENIVIIRHPAAFASSLKRLGWSFDFSHLQTQQELMDDLLFDYRYEILNPPEDIVAQASLLWKCINTVLLQFAERHPEWIVVTHEALSARPVEQFHELFKRLGLAWSDAVQKRISAFTSTKNPTTPKQGVAHQLKRNSAENVDRWKNILTSGEQQTVRRITEPLASAVYRETSWA